MTKKVKIGQLAFMLAAVCWVATPLLAFVQLPSKGIVITAMVVAGEVFFVLGLTLAGKQVWTTIKQKVKFFLGIGKKQ